MKLVALVSGGKDSCYSMLCCQQHGHEIIALANLLPPDSSVDELDSYMYQTVGHQLVEAYAACTGLPLYRRRIAGAAKSQGLAYSQTSGDEVEDLAALLAFVKERHPEVEAVASGAIASDYQRLRVEDVCARLGLVSLAYLWHRPQAELLRSMIDSGIEAVLVKVAALGLDPHKHLGRTIAAMEPHLDSLRDRFGCNVCGEGGEYETLTLDCPAFSKGRIALDAWEVRMHSPDAVAPVGVLHPTAFHVVPKGAGGGSGGGAAAAGAGGGSGGGDGHEALQALVVEVPDGWQAPVAAAATVEADAAGGAAAAEPQAVRVRGSSGHVHISCTPPPAAAGSGGGGSSSADDTAAALHAALRAAAAALPGLGLSWGDSLFVHLYLSDMGHFGAANAAYCQHLPRGGPPSRACVQLPRLPAGAPLSVDILFARPDSSSTSGGGGGGGKQRARQRRAPLARRVLHVQSISDWAPSCIGPYSQATSQGGLIHMAGQIPLDPGSMAITAADLPSQARLALAHAQAVAVAAGGCAARGAAGWTVYVAEAADCAGSRQVVAQLLGELRADPVGYVAAAERARLRALGAAGSMAAAGGAGAPAAASSSGGSGLEEEGDAEEAREAHLDDYLRPPRCGVQLQPAVVFLAVPALPRGALLEVQPLLLDAARGAADRASSSSSSSSGSDCEVVAPAPVPAGSGAAVAPLAPEAAAAVQHMQAELTQAPAGAPARLLLWAAPAAVHGGGGLEHVAAAAARQLAEAAVAAGLPLSAAAIVRSWCQQGAVDAAAWGAEIEAALAAEAGSSAAASGSAADAAAAVQSVPVSSAWVQPAGGPEHECCLAVEALWC